MNDQLKPREEVLQAFKEATAKRHEIGGSWAHRQGSDPDHAWRLNGEFGIIAELSFERRLKFIHQNIRKFNG